MIYIIVIVKSIHLNLYICQNDVLMEVVYLKILSDIHCEVYVDNEFKDVVKKNTLTKIPMRQGEYLVRLVSTINSNYKLEQIVDLKYDKIINAQFIKIAESHPEWDLDSDYRECPITRNLKNVITGKVISLYYQYHCVSDNIAPFKDGLARVANTNRKWGYLNTKGDEVIPCIYDSAEEFSEGVGCVEDKIGYRFIDTDGNVLFSKYYPWGGTFKQGYAITFDVNSAFLLDRNGNEYRPLHPALSVESYSEGRIVAVEPCDEYNGNSDHILFDLNGKQIGRWGFERILPFSEGVAVVDRGAFIDLKGEYLPFSFYEAGSFSEGMSKVRTDYDGKWGFINKQGQEEIPFLYDDAGQFSEGLAFVQIDGKYGFINKEGNVQIPYDFDEVSDFCQGLAQVRIGEDYYFIDKYGNEYR